MLEIFFNKVERICNGLVASTLFNNELILDAEFKFSL